MGEASTAYLDSGRGELEVVPRRPESDDLVMPPPTKSYGLMLTRRTRVEGESLIVESAKLPWDEFTSLYDKQDEERWLIAELMRRAKAAEATENK